MRLKVWIFNSTSWGCGESELARENVIFTGVLSSKDDTPGCTKEACNFRDSNRVMQKRGILVLGLSADSVKSHQKFADKYGLNFPLIADTDTTVSQLYNVWKEKNFAGKTYMGVNRSTFLIDKGGVVRKIWHKVKPDEHADEVLQTVEELGL